MGLSPLHRISLAGARGGTRRRHQRWGGKRRRSSLLSARKMILNATGKTERTLTRVLFVIRVASEGHHQPQAAVLLVLAAGVHRDGENIFDPPLEDASPLYHTSAIRSSLGGLCALRRRGGAHDEAHMSVRRTPCPAREPLSLAERGVRGERQGKGNRFGRQGGRLQLKL